MKALASGSCEHGVEGVGSARGERQARTQRELDLFLFIPAKGGNPNFTYFGDPMCTPEPFFCYIYVHICIYIYVLFNLFPPILFLFSLFFISIYLYIYIYIYKHCFSYTGLAVHRVRNPARARPMFTYFGSAVLADPPQGILR